MSDLGEKTKLVMAIHNLLELCKEQSVSLIVATEGYSDTEPDRRSSIVEFPCSSKKFRKLIKRTDRFTSPKA